VDADNFVRRKKQKAISKPDMSETSESEIRADTSGEKDKSIKSKQCNKFSIENILGLNDDTKVNRLELMDLCQKGRIRPV
jgi:hypothetical protein